LLNKFDPFYASPLFSSTEQNNLENNPKDKVTPEFGIELSLKTSRFEVENRTFGPMLSFRPKLISALV